MIRTFPRVFFAYLDILGFTRFVRQLDQDPFIGDDPVQKQNSLLAYYSVLEPLVIGSIFDASKSTSLKSTLSHDDGSYFVNSLIVSDSIFLWTDETSITHFISLVNVIKHLFTLNFFWELGFPMRGAISMGAITFQDNRFESPKINQISTLVGDAIVKAAMVERNQQWAGCVVDDEVITYLQKESPEIDIIHQLKQDQLIISYKADLKPEWNNREIHAVVWPFEIDKTSIELYDELIYHTFTRNGPLTEEKIQRKLDNTLAFIHSLPSLLADEV